jgi:ubiquinone/menaquinone biosynthesis C-methylase UbiE
LSWKRANPEHRLRPLLEIIPSSKTLEIWLDLGAGDGLFSKLLTTSNSNRTVIKSDISKHAEYSDLALKSYVQGPPIRLNSISGILCSQVLHYFPSQNQMLVLGHLSKFLSHGGFLVIIEYEISRAYSWIPYPIQLKNLISQVETLLPMKYIDSKRIRDGNRPKYSVCFKKC